MWVAREPNQNLRRGRFLYSWRVTEVYSCGHHMPELRHAVTIAGLISP